MSDLKEQQSFYSQINSELMESILKEKRSERRWRNFRFFIWITLILGLALAAWNYDSISTPLVDGDYVALIRLNGTIEPGAEFSAESISPALKQAFMDEKAKGIILDINSGGGTPVQASIIHDYLLSLKKIYHKKLIVVGEDYLASGAYFIAVAGDQIYVNPNTITGSIGVIMKSFGFTELMAKLGIERRVYMSGDAKDRLDPFLPQTKSDLEKAAQLLAEVQENFNKVVLEARASKLRVDPATLFNGDFWSGSTALKLGLVDGLGNLTDVMDKEFKVMKYKDYTPSPSIFNKVAGTMGASLGTFLRALG